jgi:hypothetical protein
VGEDPDGFQGHPRHELNTSSSDKARFVREADENYRRSLSASEKKVEEFVVEQFRERKAGASNLS